MQVLTEKSHFVKIVSSFLLKLDATTDPRAIEGFVYAIMRSAEGAYKEISIANGARTPEHMRCASYCDLPMDHAGAHQVKP